MRSLGDAKEPTRLLGDRQETREATPQLGSLGIRSHLLVALAVDQVQQVRRRSRVAQRPMMIVEFNPVDIAELSESVGTRDPGSGDAFRRTYKASET